MRGDEFDKVSQTPNLLIFKWTYLFPLLCCPRCQGSMRVIAFIEDESIIKKILTHLGLWEVKRKPSPVANAPPIIPDSYPIPSVDDYVIDPYYPIEAYL